MPTDAVRKNTRNAEGAIPFGPNAKVPTDGPEHHPAGAVDPDLPGRSDIDLEAVGPDKHEVAAPKGGGHLFPSKPGLD